MADRKKSANRAAKGEPLRVAGSRPRASRILILVCAVLAAGAAAASYANSLTGGFFLDNQVLIKENPLVNTPEMAGKIFRSHYWVPLDASNLYRPLTIWTYHVQHPGTPESRAKMEDALDPRPYHMVNLALHVLNAVLAFAALLFILRKVSGEDRWNVAAACLGAALFAAHPVTIEAVTNIVGRADLLVMLFLLLGLLAHMRGGERSGLRSLPYYALAAVSMALGLLSKENAIAIIAVFFLYDLLFLRPRRAEKTSFVVWLLERLKSCYGIYAIVIAAWLFVRYLVFRDLQIVRVPYADNPLVYMPFFRREATAVVVLGLYLWRMLWPVTLSADYSPEQIPAVQSVFDPRFLGSAAALVAVAVIAVLMWRHSRPAAFLILFFLVAIFPVSNIVVLTGTIGAERLLYVSSLGWAGCLALGGVYLARVFGRRAGSAWAMVPCVLLGVIAVLYGVRTHVRNKDWQDGLTFWRATAAASDRSARALQGCALALYNLRDATVLEESRHLLERALDITESYVPVHGTLGIVYNRKAEMALERQDPAAALEWFRKSYDVLKRGERSDQAAGRAALDELAAQGVAARPFVSPNWRLYSVLARTCSNLGEMLLRTGETREGEHLLEEAAKNYRVVLLTQTYDPLWNYECGRALSLLAGLREGDEKRRLNEEAAVSLWRALTFNMSYGDAWLLLKECYKALGHDADLVVAGEAGYRYKQGDNENRRYQTRAVRSFIMIARATRSAEEAASALRIAALHPVPRSALESAINERFSIDDPRIYTGE